MNSVLIIFAVMLSAAAADPAVVISNGILTSPSAAYIASSPLVSPVGAPFASLNSLPVSTLPYTAVSSLPYTAVSDYRYSYGSGLSYQDYAPVALSGSAVSLPYTLPYAYAADWYYRK
ncbi:unnamed protein product [Pieris macdunnoughi]|uniref:Uncharacterized protein n=1 Tax=Pieris macdunnoughi TaxID=345717 RepID=A0A821VJX1_9NEOP|nr:unnamed protein product [Pieris macdunnoughi]